MTSKHPKRCSNHCVHETKSPFLYGWGCNAVRDDEGRPINITVVEERLINEIGCALYSNHLELPDSCASHSSASEPVLKTSDPVWHCVVCGAITQKSHEHKYQEILEQTRKKARAEVLDTLKKDLETRFIPSSNSWSRGRNSGLLECCNIIDEYQQQQEGKP